MAMFEAAAEAFKPGRGRSRGRSRADDGQAGPRGRGGDDVAALKAELAAAPGQNREARPSRPSLPLSSQGGGS